MNEEVKSVENGAQVEDQENTHVMFEIPKGKDGEHKFYFSVPKKASLGVAYDAAIEVLNHITKVIQDTTSKLAPKREEASAAKEEEISPESEENK